MEKLEEDRHSKPKQQRNRGEKVIHKYMDNRVLNFPVEYPWRTAATRIMKTQLCWPQMQNQKIFLFLIRPSLKFVIWLDLCFSNINYHDYMQLLVIELILFCHAYIKLWKILRSKQKIIECLNFIHCGFMKHMFSFPKYPDVWFFQEKLLLVFLSCSFRCFGFT